MKLYRQGDVLLQQINELPKELTPKDNVLALGEVTGHSHRLNGAQVFQNGNGTQYFQVEEEAELVHEEHDTVTLPTGAYEVVIQREYSTLEGTRSVSD